MEFEKFGSLTRFSQGWTISEKLDGSNGQIGITQIDPNKPLLDPTATAIVRLTDDDWYAIYAGSRKRWLQPGKSTDNFGFAGWVKENAKELVEKLGPGRHFGEWYGGKIQRGYGLTKKRFALFNAGRWLNNPDKPECCEVVHTFVLDEYLDNPMSAAQGIMAMMSDKGSFHVPGFMDPEGIVLFHRKSGTSFKKTFDYDEKGKWAQQLDNRQRNA